MMMIPCVCPCSFTCKCGSKEQRIRATGEEEKLNVSGAHTYTHTHAYIRMHRNIKVLYIYISTPTIDIIKSDGENMPTNKKLDLDAPESNNNNEYLEHLTRTGPKCLHVLYKYILSTFNTHNMNAHTHFFW